MKRIAAQGKCELCGGTFGKQAMSRHLASCQGTSKPPCIPGGWVRNGRGRMVRLRVEGRYLPEYWLYLELPASSTPEALDKALRDIWLECGGHMSAFTIGERRYSSHATGDDDGSMKTRLGNLLEPDMTFTYEYDFGSTTHLKLKVISIAERELAPQTLAILARNVPPPITCGYCGKPATYVCGTCDDVQTAWVCGRCKKKHDCEDQVFLRVVNSPRTGICGYEG